jgi:ketosteroid isomerase-like protein
MSQENVDVVLRGITYFREHGDFLDDPIAPEFVWDMSTFAGWPEKQVYEGIEGAREFMRTWLEAWEDWELELVEIHDAGEKVVAVMRQRGRSKSSGLEVDMEFAQVFTLRDGIQTHMQMYASGEEGLKAAGISTSQ